MKKWLQNFMVGRRGGDELSFTMLMLYLGICIFSAFSGLDFLQILGTFIILLAFLRILSRDIDARKAENDAYMRFLSRIGSNSNALKSQRQDKEHRYYRCKHCGTVMRVPRGIGKIEITCPKCGEKITKKV